MQNAKPFDMQITSSNDPNRLSFMFTVKLHNFVGSLKHNHYRILKLKLFVIIGAIAGVPLLMVSFIAYIWLYGIAKDDFAIRFTEKIETTSLSMDYYISEKLSGLRFLASAYSYDALLNQQNLNKVFLLFQRQFGELVDLGVINEDGIQEVYAGPYNLKGKDYSTHEWFRQTTIKGYYVSDVFKGYRNIPHFAIAVKKYNPNRDRFCILRATINMESLNQRIMAMGLQASEDAFLINAENELQTDTKFYGKAMDKLDFEIVNHQSLLSNKLVIYERVTSKGFVGYKKLANANWFLVIITRDSPHDKIVELLKHNYTMVYLAIAVIVISAIVNFHISRRMVNWIETSEKNKEDAIAQSEHTNRLASIGRLAAGVAHEINNPLAIINEKAGLMKDILQMSDDFPNKDKFLHIISAITESVIRCRNITHRLLGFARQVDVNLQMLDLRDVINDVLVFLEKEIAYRDIKLNLEFDSNVPLIESDRGQLQQVFLNIINNAIDAVATEGSIRVKIFQKDSTQVAVAIEDNGSGIPKDKLKQIFEPFYTTKEKGKGTGLGLSITYGIVKKLGGEITVQSELNKGTIFTITLPIKQAQKT